MYLLFEIDRFPLVITGANGFHSNFLVVTGVLDFNSNLLVVIGVLDFDSNLLVSDIGFP